MNKRAVYYRFNYNKVKHQVKKIPTLRMVSLKDLLVHEEFDSQRVRRLYKKIPRDRIYTNPIIVASVPRQRKLMIVDGVNRFEAVKKLGLPDILVQVVNYFDDKIQLTGWNHLLARVSKKNLLKEIFSLGLNFKKTNLKSARRLLEKNKISAYLDFGSTVYQLSRPASFKAYVRGINQLVKIYAGKNKIFRTLETELKDVKGFFQGGNVLFVFPKFTKQEIVNLTNNHLKLPGGLTRHIIPERALKVNIPLSFLKKRSSLKRKNQGLNRLIRQKINNYQVRLYTEPTYIFDE